ncbi:MAG: MlaD family protein [Desulfobacteraceae bacterium]|jgi:paraquat-inducible protein B
MAKQTSKTLIGGFVVGAVALIVAGVLIFGSGQFFEERNKYLLFFRGSLKGLSVGAPVLLQGVQVGSVTDISLEADTEDMTLQIPVTIEIHSKKFKIVRGKRRSDPYESLSLLIERGLRAQLQLQSFVTGQLMIGLDFYPDTPVRLVGIDTDYPEVPTIPTPLETLSKTFRDLPLEELVNRVMSAVKGIEELVNSPDLLGSISSLHLALEDARKLIGNIDSQIEPMATGIDTTVKDYGKLARNVDSRLKPLLSNVNKTSKDWRKLARDLDGEIKPLSTRIDETLESAKEALEQAEKTLAVAEADLSEDSPTMYELNNALREISAMARSIRQLADYLKRHPEALLSGKGEGGGK